MIKWCLGWCVFALCLAGPGFAAGQASNKYAGMPSYEDQMVTETPLIVPKVFLDGPVSLQEVLNWYAVLRPDYDKFNLNLEEIPGSNGRLLVAGMNYAQNSNYLGFLKTSAGYRYLGELYYSNATAYVYPKSGTTYLITYLHHGWQSSSMLLSKLEGERLVDISGLSCMVDEPEDKKACALWTKIGEGDPTEAQLKQVFGF